MRRIVYLSSATDALDKALVEGILRISRRNNEEAGITGLLAYHDGCFFQVIEGTPAGVELVWGRIQRDTRHTGLLVLCDAEADQRAFPQWRMAYFARSDLADILDKAAIPLKEIVRQAGSLSGDRRVNKLFQSFIGSFRDLKTI